MAAKHQMASSCRTGAVVLLFLASIAAIIAVSVIQKKWRALHYGLEYGIVIDSGSSRSNIYLYQWPGDKPNDTGVVSEVMNCRVSGNGISEMKVDMVKDNASWNAIRNCMDSITKAIPSEKHRNTPLFLGATAGMRLLHEKDENRSNAVMESLREYLKKLPFMFQNASIMTGQEEGLYGWITVNYLMGKFLEKNLWNAYVRPEGGNMVGSLDLGGASTQIAFTVQDDSRGPNYLQVKLYGYPYNVYTHSYLCYGKNEAGKKILDKIIQDSSDPSYVENPCYPEGYNKTIKASTIYDTACTKKPNRYNPDQDILMVGIPDSDKCGKIVKSIFDFTTCSRARCSFNGVEQPPVNGNFMAYAGFYFTADALRMSGNSKLQEFNSTMKRFCQTHWEPLKKERDWRSPQYLHSFCYSAHYVFTLLTEGYKFNKDTWNHISFQKEVKNTSVGWSLGYMLWKSNMIPSEAKEILPISSPAYAGLIFLFSALIIVTFVILLIILIRTCY